MTPRWLAGAPWYPRRPTEARTKVRLACGRARGTCGLANQLRALVGRGEVLFALTASLFPGLARKPPRGCDRVAGAGSMPRP